MLLIHNIEMKVNTTPTINTHANSHLLCFDGFTVGVGGGGLAGGGSFESCAMPLVADCFEEF